jgi:hypothetical protein
MAGYTRTDTTNNIADGNIINAADLDNEFDGIQAAFNSSTGHNHDGTTGEGAPILVLGPTQDVVVGASTITPKTTNTVDIGSSSLKFKDLHMAGNGLIGGTLGVTGVATFTAQPVLSSLTASRAVFTDGSKGLVSNAITGTGNVVMSASPTLTGTIGGENATLSGTLGITGVATFTAQPIVSSLTASRAVFSDGSKGLVSNAITGTGNVVMSASPTLTGTISAEALTTSSTVTLNGGTANGVAYLNGSKVLTTGSALTFDGTNLALGGYGRTTGTGWQVLNNGLLTTYGANASGTLINNLDGGPIQFQISSAEQMRLTSTGLGIGTSSPGYKLDVVGFGRFSSGVLGVAGLTMYGDASSASGLFLSTSGNLGLGVTPSAWRSGSGERALQVGSRAALFCDSGLTTDTLNNVFVNTSNQFIYLASAAASRYQQNTGAHAWFTAPSGTAGNTISFTQAMTLDASGNLLLGTTSAASKFTMSGTGTGAWLTINRTDSGSNIVDFTQSGSRLGYIGYIGSDLNILQAQNANTIFSTNNTERARIDSSGQFLLGKTAFNLAQNGFACTLGDSTFTIPYGNTLHVYDGPNGVYRFYVSSAGQINATSTSISGISDRSLKENIRDLETGLPEVMALKPRRFDWKNGDAQNVAGFVAQEVEEVLPELVADYVYSKDEGGNDIVKKSLKMGDILPTLVKAIQEQQALIQTLTARVAALESN